MFFYFNNRSLEPLFFLCFCMRMLICALARDDLHADIYASILRLYG